MNYFPFPLTGKQIAVALIGSTAAAINDTCIGSTQISFFIGVFTGVLIQAMKKYK